MNENDLAALGITIIDREKEFAVYADTLANDVKNALQFTSGDVWYNFQDDTGKDDSYFIRARSRLLEIFTREIANANIRAYKPTGNNNMLMRYVDPNTFEPTIVVHIVLLSMNYKEDGSPIRAWVSSTLKLSEIGIPAKSN